MSEHFHRRNQQQPHQQFSAQPIQQVIKEEDELAFANNNIEFFACTSSSSNNLTIIKLETLPQNNNNNNCNNNSLNMDSLSNNPFLTTASVPIPTRCGINNNNNNNNNSSNNNGSLNNNNLSGNNNTMNNNINMGMNNNTRNISDLSDFVFDFDQHSQSPHMLQDISFITNSSSSSNNQNLYENQNSSGGINWNDYSQAMTMMTMTKVEPFHMDEDDIFQVDKADLIQGPTLAELNAENLYVDLLNIEDLLLPEEMAQESQLHQLQASPNLSAGSAGSSGTIQTSSVLPQQLFHSHHTSAGNSQNSNSGGIIITGQDILYDEQTNTSSSPYDNYQSPTPTRSLNSTAAFSPGSHSSNSSLLMNSITPPPPQQQHQQQQTPTYSRNKSSPGMVQHNPKYSTLHELLLKKDYAMSPDRSVMLGQSVPGPSSLMISGQALSPGGFSNRKLLSHYQSGGSSSGAGSSSSRLSSSAPTHLGLEQIWQRREPRPHLLSTGSLAEAGSTSSISTGVLSPEAPDFSHDEGYSEDDDSDHYEDFSSDNDSDNEDAQKGNYGGSNSTGGSNSKSKRYFWQYNVQAKGPKGQRLVIKSQVEDPHFLNEVTDPVFSPHCSVRGIKHSGKARKGDGNDLTPNPRKLHSIGKELDKLSRVINDMTPVSELPFNVRPKTRKEKNKLASRACRLKKKAQHEANKIKLYGLENEHKRLINGIKNLKQILAVKCSKPSNENSEEINQHIERIIKSATKVKIAGGSTEFVNQILEKFKSGAPSSSSFVLEDI